MKEIQYVDILKKSFLLSWKNKFLWSFGFLIFLSLTAESVNFSKDNLSKSTFLAALFKQNEKYFSLVVCLIIVLIVALYVLRILSSAALICAINNPALYKKINPLVTARRMNVYFWRLAGIDLLLGFSGLVIAVLLVTPVAILFSMKAMILGSMLLVCAVLIIIPLVILIFFLKKFGFIFIVLSESRLKVSMEFSYKIFLKNIKESIFMGLVMVCLTSIFMLTLILISLTLLFTGLFITIAASAIGVLILILAVSIFIVFTQSVWLSFFSQISMQKNIENETEEALVDGRDVLSPDIA